MLKLEKKEIVGISALLIHAAKIDEIYSEKEKKIIKNFIENNISEITEIDKIIKDAEKLEENSNQLLNYTKITLYDALKYNCFPV